MNLDKLLRPKSITVVGATDRAGSFGESAARQALKSRVERVYLVNPSRTELFGQPCYRSLSEVPEVTDCAVVCTPRDAVLPILEQAAVLGIGAGVVYASGFSEEHSEQGDELERRMAELSHKHGFPILGPNCGGLLNNEDKISLWGLTTGFDMQTRTGGIAVIAQSGYIGQNMVNTPYFNISYAISTGNGNCTTLEDFFSAVVDDERVKVAALYIEGVKDAEKLAESLARAARLRKPVVILKSGKSSKGAKAAASHTGNLAGSAAAYDAVFEKFGVVSVDSIEEFICAAQMFSVLAGNFPKPAAYAGLNLSGGENALCADLAEKHRVELPDLSPSTIEEIRKYLPDFATASNPLDGTTSLFSKIENIENVIHAADRDDNVGGIIFGVNIGEKINGGPPKAITDAVLAARRGGCRKPIFLVGSQETTKGLEVRTRLEASGIVLTSCGETGYSVLGKLAKFAAFDPESSSLALAVPDAPLKGESEALTEYESKLEMAQNGVPIPKSRVAANPQELNEALKEIDGPLALKIHSPDILHKTEAGGVKLGIRTRAEAEAAYAEIMKSCSEFNPDARLEGVLVSEMVPAGTEIIIGVTNDNQFGPLLLVGLGGIFVEVFKDAVLYPCPVSRDEARAMLRRLKAFKLLDGYRGKAPADVDALIDVMVRVSEYAAANRNTLKELDLNPVFVYDRGEGVKVVDALVVKCSG